jgi:hypothetical protein
MLPAVSTHIEIHWPIPEGASIEWRNRTVMYLEDGAIDDIIAAYGDIYSFQAFHP